MRQQRWCPFPHPKTATELCACPSDREIETEQRLRKVIEQAGERVTAVGGRLKLACVLSQLLSASRRAEA
jgi:hypothetical protein